MANLNEDISVPSAGLLAAASEAGMTEGQTCYVATYGDTFQWHPYQTVPAVPNVVINGTTGQWTRMGIPNAKWQTQTTWSIDESNVSGLANDENSGIDDTHPLLTIDEFIRRMGRVVLAAPTTLRWMSDTVRRSTDLSSITGGISTATSATGGFPLVIIGVPTIIATGTLTGATDAPWTVTDSALATSWTASGCVSTTSGTRLIRKTDGTKSAFIGYENSAKTAQTSPTTGVTDVYGTLGTVAASFIAGDAYNVYSLPKFPRVTPPNSVEQGFLGAYFFLLDMASVNGSSSQIRNCGFYAIGNVNMSQRGGKIFVYGAVFMSIQGISGTSITSYIDRTMALASFTFSAWAGDLNGATNVVAKAGSFIASHSAIGRLGTVYVFDNTVVNGAIFVNNNSNVTLDAVHGSGNTQLVINIRDPGCSVNSPTTTPLTAFDATTSFANPISVCGTQFAYAAVPITAAITTKLAGFVTN